MTNPTVKLLLSVGYQLTRSVPPGRSMPPRMTGDLSRNEEIEVGIEEVVLAADAHAEEGHPEQGPDAAVEPGVTQADEALGADLGEAGHRVEQVVVGTSSGPQQELRTGTFEPGAGGEVHAPMPARGLTQRRDEPAVARRSGPLCRP